VSKEAQGPSKSDVFEKSNERSVTEIDNRGEYHNSLREKDEPPTPGLRSIADKWSQAEQGSLTHYMGECAERMLAESKRTTFPSESFILSVVHGTDAQSQVQRERMVFQSLEQVTDVTTVKVPSRIY